MFAVKMACVKLRMLCITSETGLQGVKTGNKRELNTLSRFNG